VKKVKVLDAVVFPKKSVCFSVSKPGLVCWVVLLWVGGGSENAGRGGSCSPTGGPVPVFVGEVIN